MTTQITIKNWSQKRKDLELETKNPRLMINKKPHTLLTSKTMDNKHKYNNKDNYYKAITRQAHQDQWDNFKNNIEHDIHDRHSHENEEIMNKTEKYTDDRELMSEENRYEHYSKH